MSKGKSETHQFENGIYPMKFFVVVGNNLSAVENTFEELDGTPIKLEEDNVTPAFTLVSPVIRKESEDWGILVVFNSRKCMSEEVVAHECLHATTHYAKQLGLMFYDGESNEGFTYLLQWMVKCCKMVRKNKYE